MSGSNISGPNRRSRAAHFEGSGAHLITVVVMLWAALAVGGVFVYRLNPSRTDAALVLDVLLVLAFTVVITVLLDRLLMRVLSRR